MVEETGVPIEAFVVSGNLKIIKTRISMARSVFNELGIVSWLVKEGRKHFCYVNIWVSRSSNAHLEDGVPTPMMEGEAIIDTKSSQHFHLPMIIIFVLLRFIFIQVSVLHPGDYLG